MSFYLNCENRVSYDVRFKCSSAVCIRDEHMNRNIMSIQNLFYRIPVIRFDVKQMRIKKLLAILLASVILAAVFTLSPAISSLMNYVIIESGGRIELGGSVVTASSGSAEDIQEAVDLVRATGGTVYVPAGTFYWNSETVNSVDGVNIIGAGGGSNGTILHNNKAAPFDPMFVIDGSNHKPFRISGIRFEGTVTSSNDDVDGSAIQISSEALDFRVDHCTFINFPNEAIGVFNFATGTIQGVIDHNIIDNPYKDVYGGLWAYGIVIAGQYANWDEDITHFLGKYETAPSGFPIVYIEDNHFSRCRHAIASTQSAWYVARYNVIDDERPENFGSVDVHGASSPTTPGGRGLEAYNNTIIGTAGYDSAQAFWIRGGGGVIFNNTMQNILYGIGLFREEYVPSQVEDLWIWGNNMDGGTLINNYGEYEENVDYFLRAPNQGQDGFTYTPYPYPHPLTVETKP